VRRRAALRDHVLQIEYGDICTAFVVASTEIGSGQFGRIRKCVERATGQQYACKTVYKINIRVRAACPITTVLLLTTTATLSCCCFLSAVCLHRCASSVEEMLEHNSSEQYTV